MKPSEDHSTVADGGASISLEDSDLFTRTAADIDQPSMQEKLSQWYDLHVYAPFAVAWTDMRTRVGTLIMILFFLTGAVAVLSKGFTIPIVDHHIVVDLVARPAVTGPLYEPPMTGAELTSEWPFLHVEYPLGTDRLGRDLFDMVIHATPAMIKIVLAGSLLSITIGTIVGTLAGYTGGVIDRILMIFTDTILTIPALVLVIVLSSVWTIRDPYVVGLILGIDNWPALARTLRSQVLSLREESYVEASRAMGLNRRTIMRMDVATNLMPYILPRFAASSKRIIFESVALYYLGILPFTSLNWGVMLNEAYNSGKMTELDKVHWILVPMAAIIIVSLGFMLFAQGMDRVFNVRLRAKHAKTQDERGKFP